MKKRNNLNDIPTYSIQGLNALNEFYGRTCIVYVEGDDDVLFGESVFNRAEVNDVQILSVGGREQLAEKISNIQDEGALIIVACDSDYNYILERIKRHPQVIYTYGYSIENSMYCPKSLNNTVRKLVRSNNTYTDKAESWMTSFCEEAKELIVFDLANEKYGKGMKIMGDNCARFLTKNGSCQLSQSKVKRQLNGFNRHFTVAEIQKCKRIIDNTSKPLSAIVRGHFLTTAVLNWLQKQNGNHRPRGVSKDLLYSNCVDACTSCCDTECEQWSQMLSSVITSWRIVKKHLQND